VTLRGLFLMTRPTQGMLVFFDPAGFEGFFVARSFAPLFPFPFTPLDMPLVSGQSWYLLSTVSRLSTPSSKDLRLLSATL